MNTTRLASHTARAFPGAAAFVVVAVIFAVAGCSSVTVHTDSDLSADFSHYKTYQWAPRTESGNEDPRVSNAVVESQVMSAVDSALVAKGFSKTEDSPSFLVAWHGAIEGRMSTNAIHNSYGYGWGWYPVEHSAAAREWDEGTLIVDIVDAGTNTLVWRGTAQTELNKYATRDQDEEVIRKIVARLFKGFPPSNAR